MQWRKTKYVQINGVHDALNPKHLQQYGAYRYICAHICL